MSVGTSPAATVLLNEVLLVGFKPGQQTMSIGRLRY
jgi:hypothetical protein